MPHAPSAAYVRILPDHRVQCQLCPHLCKLKDNQVGKCRTRRNLGGSLRVLTHGRLQAAAVDPIEKKPLNHFRPGSVTFSIASDGCNLVCPFCQNYSLSQKPRSSTYDYASVRQWSPESVVETALGSDCESIAFTYSEPILSFEFAKEVAAISAPKGLDVVYVTNGQINREPAHELAQFIGAANVDLKAFNESTYKKVLGGYLGATLNTIAILAKHNVWIEVTTLIVPGLNDSEIELRQIAEYIASISVHIPWHVSRFHPTYKWLQSTMTPKETLRSAYQIGLDAGLRYVYTGNIPGDLGEKTLCPNCQDVIVDRVGYTIAPIKTQNGRCKKCGEIIAGVGFP